ncbi:MAG: hypothetical protein JXB00_12480 [Bacteroidales bacterium]|nr:hypothetical protein [Bacteroidales bacterium]
MKKITFSIITIFIYVVSFAQMPETFNYQAVVRNADGDIVKEQAVSFKIEILKGSETGDVVFAETHSVTTSQQGVATFAIGAGDHTAQWMPIDWSLDAYYLKVYLDLTNGANFEAIGTSPILAVPVALYAENIKNLPSVAGCDTFKVEGTIAIGYDPVKISDITSISGTTDATNNYINLALPEGFDRLNTYVLSVTITNSSGGLYPNYYRSGLGFTGTNGTIGYQLIKYGLVQLGNPINVIRIYYPDELKSCSVEVLLMRKK